MDYILTQHAKDVLMERDILIEWLERVLIAPEKIQADTVYPEVEHRLGKIFEYGNRVLRVVYNKETHPVRVITVYFDRTMKGRL
mgnify:CR=1 FL=1